MREKEITHLSFVGVNNKLRHFRQEHDGGLEDLGEIDIELFFEKLLSFHIITDDDYKKQERYPLTLHLKDGEENILEFIRRSESHYDIRFFYKLKDEDFWSEANNEDEVKKQLILFFKGDIESLLNIQEKQSNNP